MFEQSSFSSSPLYLSSWDVRKAFDSLSKNALQFSWTRLGVPSHIADLLVSLDEKGHTIVRSPYAQREWSKRKYQGFSDRDYFSAIRGAGQGDVSSPFNWDAAFDILLCALSSVSSDQFYISSSTGHLSPASDIAYADDLLSGMASLTGLQLKADIVSAYSIIFGLDIAINKLRTFVHYPNGPPRLAPGSPSPSVVIHTSDWQPHSIPVLSTGTLKVLGKFYDISSPSIHASQFAHCKKIADTACNILSRTLGSPANLSMVASTVIAKRVEYGAQFSSWTQSEYDDIDKPFTKLYRKISSNMSSYPTSLIYLPRKLGGLGCYKVSDGIQRAKYSMIQRHLRCSGSATKTMDTLLYNAAVNSSQSPAPGFSVTIRPAETLDSSCWANSVLHFAASGDVFLSRQGCSDTHHPSSTIITVPRPSKPLPLFDWVSSHSIHHLGDLYSVPANAPSSWNDFSSTGGALLSTYQIALPPGVPVVIRPRQYWIPSEDSIVPPYNIVETQGWTDEQFNSLNYRLLPLLHPRLPSISNPAFPSRTPLMGGRSSLSDPAPDVLGTNPRRIFLSSPQSSSSFLYPHFIAGPATYSLPSAPSPSASWLPDDFLTTLSGLGDYDIFTDGAWARAGSYWDHVTHNSPSFIGSAGLVFISRASDWKDRPIITLHIINGQGLNACSAFSMEALAILVALFIRSCSPPTPAIIYSDCKSVVLKLQKLVALSSPLKTTSGDASLLSACVSFLSRQSTGLCWIKGHPERSVPDESFWSREMWGNHLADRAAAGSLTTTSVYSYKDNFENHVYIHPLPTQDASSLTSSLIPDNTWFFGTSDMQLRSPSLMDSIYLRRLDQYLRDRDRDRSSRSLPPKWHNRFIPLAALLWDFSKNPASLAFHNRILWDKHWHQGNKAKAVDDPKLKDTISKCPLCAETDSAYHWNLFCDYPRAHRIRQDTISSLRTVFVNLASQRPSLSSNIMYIGNHFLSMVHGVDQVPDIWRGIWTSSQLDSFRVGRDAQFISDIDLNVLKSLFLQLGRVLLAGTTTLWHSRQQAILELDAHMKLYPHPSYVPPDYLYPSPEPFPSLPFQVLQELRNRITAPDVLSVVSRPPAAPKTWPKLSLPSFAACSSQPPSPPTLLPGPSSISSSATGSGILAYFPPSTIQVMAAPTALPTVPATKSKQKRKIRPRISIPMYYKHRVKVPGPLPDQPSVANLRTLKTPLSTANSPEIPSLPSPPSTLTTLSTPAEPSPPKPTSPLKIPSSRKPQPPPERHQPRVKVSKYVRSESGLSFHVVYDSSLPPPRARSFLSSPITPLSPNSPSVKPVVQFDTPTQIYDPG